MEKIMETAAKIFQNKVITLVMVAVVLDTIFGVIRAIREHSFNSCFGIDGAIRKISMIISIAGLVIVDRLVNVNLIAFVPETAREYIGLETIGTAEFFGLLYICYEVVSVLKNMYLCGLPVKWVWEKTEKFLSTYTKELPDSDDTPTTSTKTDSTVKATDSTAAESTEIKAEDAGNTESKTEEVKAAETENGETG